MTNTPAIEQRHGYFSISFSDHPNQVVEVKTEIILDLTRDESVKGIEILGLFAQLGENSLGHIANVDSSDPIRHKYDHSSDSFYMHILPGESWNQKSVTGLSILDKEGRVLSFIVSYLD